MRLHESPNHLQSWAEAREQLRQMVGDSAFELWLAPIRVRHCDQQRLLLAAPAQTHRWVLARFGKLIERCLKARLGEQLAVEIVPDRDVGQSAGATTADERGDAHVGAQLDLNPRYTFQQFIIGDGNRLAHAAALAVAELPGQAYNPLFIHGGPGRGKTHLLHAIGHYISAYGGATRVRYTTVEAFTNDFIASLRAAESSRQFKLLYRGVDVLLVDDIQFLASKAKTEEEFFHTFNALHQNGRQLVLTCDRVPQQLLNIDQRLRERFQAGLVAEISPPDLATRVAILRKRAQLDGIVLSDPEVIEFIARRVEDNVRALEGALIRVVARHSLTGRPLDLELAQETLGNDAGPTGVSAPSLRQIQEVVAGRYGLSIERMLSTSRASAVAAARQIAIYLARQLTDASLTQIGQAFGGRNHATIVYACKRVDARLAADQSFQHELSTVRAAVLSRPMQPPHLADS